MQGEKYRRSSHQSMVGPQMAEHQPVSGPDAAQTQKCLWLTHSMVARPVLHQATYLSSFLYSV